MEIPEKKRDGTSLVHLGDRLAKGNMVGAGIDDNIKLTFKGFFYTGDVGIFQKGFYLLDFVRMFFNDQGEKPQAFDI